MQIHNNRIFLHYIIIHNFKYIKNAQMLLTCYTSAVEIFSHSFFSSFPYFMVQKKRQLRVIEIASNYAILFFIRRFKSDKPNLLFFCFCLGHSSNHAKHRHISPKLDYKKGFAKIS